MTYVLIAILAFLGGLATAEVFHAVKDSSSSSKEQELTALAVMECRPEDLYGQLDKRK